MDFIAAMKQFQKIEHKYKYLSAKQLTSLIELYSKLPQHEDVELALLSLIYIFILSKPENYKHTIIKAAQNLKEGPTQYSKEVEILMKELGVENEN